MGLGMRSFVVVGLGIFLSESAFALEASHLKCMQMIAGNRAVEFVSNAYRSYPRQFIRSLYGPEAPPDYFYDLFTSDEELKGREELLRVLSFQNPKVASLVDRLVRLDNLQIKTLMHQSPEEIEKSELLIMEHSHHRSVVDQHIGIAKSIFGDRFADVHLPMQSMIWFKKVPKGLRVERPLDLVWRKQGSLDEVGEVVYDLATEPILPNAVYSIGDLPSVLARNNPDEVRRRRPIDRRYTPRQFAGVFPLSDLRPLLIWAFSTLHEIEKQTHQRATVLPMPHHELLQVSTWSPVRSKYLHWDVRATHRGGRFLFSTQLP